MACCAGWIDNSGLHCGCSNSHFLWCLWLEAEGKDILKAHSCLMLVKWFGSICVWEVKIKCQRLSLGCDKTHFCQVWISLPVTGFTQCYWSFQVPSSSVYSQQDLCFKHWLDNSWAFCDSFCTVMYPINKTNTWHNSLQDHFISVYI
jgi:hypothetical protein